MKTIEKDFWLFWGESPEGSTKREKGEAVIGFIREVAETALRECRPKDITIECHKRFCVCSGYKECLSDYDERVNQFLK